MQKDAIWANVDHHRSVLADLLDDLAPVAFTTPSLCPGWTVRDVGVHLTMAQVKVTDVLVPMFRARFDLNHMIRDVAISNPLCVEEIAPALRGMLGSRRRAPFVSDMEPLLDVVVHTQDIAIPLGIRTESPAPEAATAIADRLVALNRVPRMRLRPPLDQMRLSATDVAWTSGEGPEVRGPILALIMAIAGRSDAVLSQLTGPTHLLAR